MADARTSLFTRFAKQAAEWMGHPVAFIVALASVVAWGLAGPVFGYSDTWQLVINTFTTLVTFLMVFLIQNTQNRDSEALQIKLDELLSAMARADKSLLDLEELDKAELDRIRDRYKRLAKRARQGEGSDDRTPC